MIFSPDDIKKQLIEVYGFELILKQDHSPYNKKVHRLKHPQLENLLHIQHDTAIHANLALPFIQAYEDQVEDILKINGISGGKESNRSCFLNYPDKIINNPTPQKRALCFTFMNITAFVEFMDSFFWVKLDDQAISETEGNMLTKFRLGQGRYRNDLMSYWEGCAVTGCKNPNLLVASHIKPWAVDETTRLDIYNGFMLIPNLDMAFDKGLISFDDNGNILISSTLSVDDRESLGLKSEMCLLKIEEGHTKYLTWHRFNLFKR